MKSDETHEYFSLNDHEPLILVKKGGLKMGAMRIDRQTGEFTLATTAISLIERSPDIDSISELRFFELVEQFRRTLRCSGSDGFDPG